MKNHSIVEKSISRNRLKEITDNFSQKKIAIIGDIILDEYINGNVKRISPEAPVPVVNVVHEYHKLGGAANVARNIKSLNSEALLIGTIGDDYYSKMVRGIMKENDLDDRYLLTDIRKPTTKKTRVISDHYHQQIVRMDWEDKSYLTPEIETKIIEILEKEKDDIDAVIISDYGKGVITPSLLARLSKYSREFNIFTAVDPKIKNFSNYKEFSLITPNNNEAGSFWGEEISDKEDLKQAGFDIINRLNTELLLITRGEQGMTLFERDTKNISNFPTVAKQVFDVTGAGDVVISTFVLAHISGAEYPESAWISNHAAGISVGHIGTYSVCIDELFEAFEEENEG